MASVTESGLPLTIPSRSYLVPIHPVTVSYGYPVGLSNDVFGEDGGFQKLFEPFDLAVSQALTCSPKQSFTISFADVASPTGPATKAPSPLVYHGV